MLTSLLKPFFAGYEKMEKVSQRGLRFFADVIIPFSFGLPYNGKSNQVMAKTTAGLSLKYDLPIIGQWEIVDFLRESDDPAHANVMHKVGPYQDKYLDSFDVSREAAQYCLKEGMEWRRAVVVAHPDHVWRCKRTLEKDGFTVLVPPGLEAIPYDPDSEQIWTRSENLFVPREIAARTAFKLTGKL